MIQSENAFELECTYKIGSCSATSGSGILGNRKQLRLTKSLASKEQYYEALIRTIKMQCSIGLTLKLSGCGFRETQDVSHSLCGIEFRRFEVFGVKNIGGTY